MSERRDSLEQFICDELKNEAEDIKREVDRANMPAMPADLKAKIKAQLDQRIEEYEKERLYAQLSEEDREALALGKKLLEEQKEEKVEEKVVTYKKKRTKVYVALVAAIVLVLAMGITSVGGPDRILQKIGIEIGDREVELVNSNEENLVMAENNEDTAYQEVEDVFGTKPVRIFKRADEMRFASFIIDEERQVVEIYYDYEGETIAYLISTVYTESSWGIDVEDTITNEYTIDNSGQLIGVKEYETPDTKTKRYSARFMYNELEYFLMGTMEQEEFDFLIKNLKFF